MSEQKTLLVGTRDSILARLQTDMALAALKKRFPDLQFEIIAVKTSGDKNLSKPLPELGGRGVFVKELEEALLSGQVDFVVHSLKDLPTDMPPNLVLAATLARDDARDVLVSREGFSFKNLSAKCKVATSSRRRAAQLCVLRNDLEFVDIRGNIQTRMRKLEEGQCDAMVLAAAGLHRLGMQERISHYFSIEECIPAVGQGALAIECREDKSSVLAILKAINDASVSACITAERAFLNKLGGGCSVPVGANAVINADNELVLTACVVSMDGKQVFKHQACSSGDPSKLGAELADKMIAEGAGEIIAALMNASIGLVSPP